jgi:hypothetical protein
MRLAELFKKYGTDKLTLGYAGFYEVLFAARRYEVTPLLEVGIGTMIPGACSSMVGFGAEHYAPGASLRAWRDYFPNAQIYGIDVQPDTQFSEARISTMLCDSTDIGAVAQVLDNKSFNVIIDDGSHDNEDQLITLANLWSCLDRGGTYVIEDLTSPKIFENQDKLREIIGDAPYFFVKLETVGALVIMKL